MKKGERFHAVLQVTGMRHTGKTARMQMKDTMSDKTYEMQLVAINKLIKKAEWVGPLIVDGLWEVTNSDNFILIKPILPDQI